MVYSVQNSETGEMQYIYRDMNSIKLQVVDNETGEPLNGTMVKVRYVKHNNFAVPKIYLRDTTDDQLDTTNTTYDSNSTQHGINVKLLSKESECAEKSSPKYKKEDFMNMEGVKNDIILGYRKANYQTFLIPTFFCFKVGFYLILMIIETILHLRSHHKNVLNSNKAYFFRSPLHLLTSQFCGICRGEKEMDIEIFKMLNKQMRGSRQSKTLKDVSKVIA
ncbi:uncharacterized protein [Eurosta solidaginis]|uniref:uncharacterized protein n=1 Tax=Eurosta solidaginis TaxID=178769 RepID=UPI0035317D83